jgi:hypothetical protein
VLLYKRREKEPVCKIITCVPLGTESNRTQTKKKYLGHMTKIATYIIPRKMLDTVPLGTFSLRRKGVSKMPEVLSRVDDGDDGGIDCQ